jgi:hypothetical protein
MGQKFTSYPDSFSSVPVEKFSPNIWLKTLGDPENPNPKFPTAPNGGLT